MGVRGADVMVRRRSTGHSERGTCAKAKRPQKPHPAPGRTWHPQSGWTTVPCHPQPRRAASTHPPPQISSLRSTGGRVPSPDIARRSATHATTEAFLAAFRRFVSRRGLCSTLYSDRGTNFVGADPKLRELFGRATRNCQIADALANEGVQWRFNPPAAPHFGGIWEAAVKSTKHHLQRVMGDSTLTFEEMTMFLTQVEACLNSRPLTALSDDPGDLSALTPGHFLIGAPLNAISEPSLADGPTRRLTRWQLVQQMRDHFWKRWAREYLQALNSRPKWTKGSGNPRVGDLCLIRGENSPPASWPLARITAVHPGADGQVRVVTLRTATTSLKRPTCKIIPLGAAEAT